jgi:hypothetical protein
MANKKLFIIIVGGCHFFMMISIQTNKVKLARKKMEKFMVYLMRENFFKRAPIFIISCMGWEEMMGPRGLISLLVWWNYLALVN